jgi:cytoskeletal protein CcmA (bactofilin family)
VLGEKIRKTNEIKNAPVAGCMNIGEKVLFKGDVLNAESINIDGSFEGKVETADFILGKTGFFKGDVVANTANIKGTIDGTILIKDKLSISGEGSIKGKVIYKTIAISDKAQIEGTLKKYKGSDNIIVKDEPILEVKNKSSENTRVEPKKAAM